ncbi:MAG: ORF6N domain-containing protein [Bacteroidetes bacterium]|jgi:hypothetical protein|nr:ORF6N domain-containing protein [Bacteroidota bacterium]
MKNEIQFSTNEIQNRIFSVRGVQVMLDVDLAEIYHVTTGRLNEQVKRNLNRFPTDFMFQLTETEWFEIQSQKESISLSSQNAILKDKRGKHRKYLPYVFTEQGVAGLSGVIKNSMAAKVHVEIMRAFIEMRRVIQDNQFVNFRLNNLERKHIETEQRFEEIFKALDNREPIPKQGVFFNGQVFDAYELASKIIRSAKKNIILIDNYIDETSFTHLAKKEKSVKATILVKTISNQLTLDLQKANEQYGNFEIKVFNRSHDRFLIIDKEIIYHLGASLKDLGKKWFAFSLLEKLSVQSIISELENL